MRAAVIFAITCWSTVLLAQDYLTPEPGILAEVDDYHAKIREVFAETLTGEVLLQVVFLPSFEVEEIAGIRKTDKGFEAFASKPSSSVWSTYSIWAIESGKQQWRSEDGKDIPPDKNPYLPDLKRHAPSDFRQISVHTNTRLISVSLTERLKRIWEKMLLDAQHPKNPRIGTDGETFHFSMWIQGHGVVSAQVWSPTRGKTLAFTYLAEALADYAKGPTDDKMLAKFIKRLER